MTMTPESVEELLRSENFGDRIRAVNQIRQLDPAQGFALLQLVLKDRNVRVRYAAVSQMSTLGSQDLDRAISLLREGLQDPEPDVQAAAADSIAALKLTAAFDDLETLYHATSEWLVQFSIVAALGELGDSRAFPLLEAALNSGNDLLQTAAIGSLGELGDVRAVDLLLPFVSNSDWQVRHRLAQALGRLGTAEAKTALVTLAEDAVQPVADEAKAALQLSA